jgi:hypothetical protein
MEKLKASIESFPEMMKLRPMVYDPDTMEVLGGNQRLLAIRALGMKEIPDDWAKSADELTEKEKREFIIRDNIQSGDWDFEILEAEFNDFALQEMGIDMPDMIDIEKIPKEVEIKTSFDIIINFDTEEELQEAYEKLTKEGYKCKISIL